MNYWLYLGIICLGSILLLIAADRRHYSAYGFAALTILFSRIVHLSSPAMWWGNDSYWYWLITESILKQGSLTAFPGTFASGSPRSQTAIFNILTAAFSYVSGFENAEILRTYFPLVMAIGFFLSSLMLLQYILPRYVALVSAFLYSMFDMTIVESSTYTQFGFFVVFTIFFLTLLFPFQKTDSWLSRLLIFTFAFISGLTHIISALLLPLWGLTAIAAAIGWNRVPFGDFSQIVSLKSRAGVLALVAIFSSIIIFMNVHIFDLFIRDFPVQESHRTVSRSIALDTWTAGSSIIGFFPFATKVVLISLSIPVFTWHIRDDIDSKVEVVGLLGVSGALIGGIGYFISADVLGRVLHVGYVFFVGTAAFAVLRWAGTFPWRRVVAGTLIILLIVGNVPNGVAPSYVDESVDINADGFHRVTPIEAQGPTAGKWIKSYHPTAEPIASQNLYSPIIFYYGDSEYRQFGSLNPPISGTILFDLDRGLRSEPRTNRYYHNGRVVIESGNKINIKHAPRD